MFLLCEAETGFAVVGCDRLEAVQADGYKTGFHAVAMVEPFWTALGFGLRGFSHTSQQRESHRNRLVCASGMRCDVRHTKIVLPPPVGFE